MYVGFGVGVFGEVWEEEYGGSEAAVAVKEELGRLHGGDEVAQPRRWDEYKFGFLHSLPQFSYPFFLRQGSFKIFNFISSYICEDRHIRMHIIFCILDIFGTVLSVNFDFSYNL